ncbi:hypothetical protein Btru_010043 [Bulinus truncatus]|nr:hypothetical protein Btru_010043 [Bulinus truncatus]
MVNSPIVTKTVTEDSILNVVDPFKPKAQMVNSPIVTKTVTEDSILNVVDPFKPKAQMVNSPIVTKTVTEDSILNVVDPFKPKAQMVNSPIVTKTVTEDSILNVVDPFKPKAQMVNSPIVTKTVTEDSILNVVDPFKPKAQMVNSPIVTKTVTEDSILNVVDPFKPKAQMVNSPIVTKTVTEDSILNVVDPFKPKIQMINSPVVPKSVTEDSILNVEDPFKPKVQMVDSPVVTKATGDNSVLNEVDPFKPCAQMVNSPLVTKTVIEDNILHEIDPFKAKIQMVNSPVVTKATEDSILNADDSFLPVVNISVNEGARFNTSILEKTVLGLKKPVTVPNSNCEIVDNLPPLSVSEHLSINQCVNGITAWCAPDNTVKTNMGCCDTTLRRDNTTAPDDDFSLSGQKCNIAAADTQNAHLSAGSETIVNELTAVKSADELSGSSLPKISENNHTSGVKDSCMNATIANSLMIEDQLASTVVSQSSENQSHLSTVEASSAHKMTVKDDTVLVMKSGVHIIDPVLPLASEPSRTVLVPSDGLCSKQSDHSASVPLYSINKETNQVGAVNASVAVDIVSDLMDGSVPKKTAFILPLLSEDILQNEQFVPASEALFDEKFFDMLEQTSNEKESVLRRGSVLMKFDPLMKCEAVTERLESIHNKQNSSPGPVQRPSRMSDIFSTSKNLGVSFLDESACLFGTPPRVARRRTLTRNIHNNRVQPIFEEESAPNKIDMILALDDIDGMDSVIHDNLIPKAEGAKLVDIGEIPTYTESDVQQIRAQLAMHFQDLMLKKDREFQEKLKQQEDLSNEEKTKAKEAYDVLRKKNKSLQGKLKSFDEVMKQYEGIIAQITTENEKTLKDQEKQAIELVELQKSNSQILEDNKALEKSFADLYHRYEKLKETLEKAAENEKILKKAVETAQEKYKSVKEASKKIKTMAEEKLAEAEEKVEKLSSSSKAEITRLEAIVKKNNAQIQTLESILERKTQENKELTEVCDSLISKVS